MEIAERLTRSIRRLKAEKERLEMVQKETYQRIGQIEKVLDKEIGLLRQSLNLSQRTLTELKKRVGRLEKSPLADEKMKDWLVKIGQVAGSVELLQDRVKELTDGMSRLRREVLKKHTQAVARRVEAQVRQLIEQRVQDVVASQTDELGQAVQAQVEQMEEVRERLLDRIASLSAEIGQRVDEVNEAFGGFERRLDELGQSVQANRLSLDELAGQVSGLGPVEGLAKAIDTVKAELHKLGQSVQAQAEKVEQMSQDLASWRTAVEERIVSIEEVADSYEVLLGKLREEMPKTFVERVKRISAQVAGELGRRQAEKLRRVGQEVAKLSERVAQLAKQRVDADEMKKLTASVGEMARLYKQVVARLDRTERKAKRVDKRADQVTAQVEALRDQMKGLGHELKAVLRLREEVRALKKQVEVGQAVVRRVEAQVRQLIESSQKEIKILRELFTSKLDRLRYEIRNVRERLFKRITQILREKKRYEEALVAERQAVKEIIKELKK